MIELKETKDITGEQIKELFNSVGWDTDTKPEVLKQMINNSSHVITAWSKDKLVGFARSMDDDCWRATIDCLVVHKDYQRLSIGTMLIKRLLSKIKHIHTISVSPNESENTDFYEKRGFDIIKDGKLLQISNG